MGSTINKFLIKHDSELKTQNTLKKIDINATLYETFSQIVISQSYINATDKPQEISFELNPGNNMVLHSFTAKMNNKVYISKIYDKEIAEEKYTDSIASGNLGIMGIINESKPEFFCITIGNLQPDEELQLDVELIGEIKSEDLSYKFFFPLFKIPTLIVEKEIIPLPAIIHGVQTDQKDKTLNVPITFSAVYVSPTKITRFACPTHKSSHIQISDDNLIVQIAISSDEIFSSNSREISILFRNSDINVPRLYEEYDPKLKVYSYMLNYKMDERTSYKSLESLDTDPSISYYDNYEKHEVNETPSSFIFLLDQSGSMSGSSMETAKEALKIFIKSLPTDSEFSLIGFGSNFKDYFNILQYNQTNVDIALDHINSLSANLGGTNIFSPLNYIFEKSKNFNKKYPKNVFLLTDGCVDDSSTCLDLIRKNNNNFRVHSFGIGSGVSSDFISGCGEVGKGTYAFARDIKEITSKVIYSLNRALKEYYSNLEINFSSEPKIELDYPEKMSINIIYQDEILSYSFITKEKFDKDAYITMTAGSGHQDKILSKKLNVNEIIFKMSDNNYLNKFIAASRCKHDSKLKADQLKTISKFYQVPTKETSLFAEIENRNSTDSEMSTVKIPVVYLIHSPSQPFKEKLKYCKPMASVCYSGISDNNKAFKTLGAPQSNIRMNAPVSFMKQSVNSITEHSSMSLNKKCTSKKMKSKEMNTDLIKSNVEKIEFNDLECESEERCNEKKSSVKNEKKSFGNECLDLYKDLIDSQMISGEWSYEKDKNDVIKKISNMYVEEVKKISESVKVFSLENENEKKIVVTILAIWVLNTMYSHLKTEFFLITNKANRFLSKFKINYNDIELNLKN